MGEISTSGYKDYVAGLLAGVSAVATGHPFDTVKVMLQKHNAEPHLVQYRNGLHCTARIFKTEGIKGFYRGATSSFAGMALEGSLFFGIYSQTKQYLQGGVQNGLPQPQVILPSAALSGAIISFVLGPTELIKCRMQIQGADSLVLMSSRYSSPLDCIAKTLKTEGVKGLFRGSVTTLLRESIGNATFLSVYEYTRYHMYSHIKPASSNYNDLIEMGIGVVTGGLGGVAFWAVAMPLDVAKTLIQTNPDKNCQRNPFMVLSSIYKRTGLKGCYTGLGPTLSRAFPANAATIVTWELASKMLGIRHD
ncbi:mitochondrial arginine transporter BAC1 [Lathyrus oleraceus]|uniref:Mitochondrial arginine transporter bac1 n=1 Tax=Pisum sativum TaxID=3888 RepID=A0A9D4VNT1_PEA|nr:mitochondrial arginine transporter BAC1 [Pisum sativum]XP_050899379.1 mitochondrial arginine transporter BAC1 [Pisum sativum]KAI5386658.1 Mitochondrial arginine transporter bac1 [Pisum sativum]